MNNLSNLATLSPTIYKPVYDSSITSLRSLPPTPKTGGSHTPIYISQDNTIAIEANVFYWVRPMRSYINKKKTKKKKQICRYHCVCNV